MHTPLTLSQTLKNAGSSTTKARMAVFTVLKDNHTPLSMAQLVSRLKDTANRASVYRSIELFESIGIVNKISTGWKYKLELSDLFLDHHHHLTCTQCAALINIEGDTHIEKDIAELTKKYGFVLKHHQLEIQGVCANCQKAK